MGKISRSEVLRRAATMWPKNSVMYSQSVIHPNGYRQDCSGFVSMCWGIPPNENGGWGGQNTVTLVTRGYMYEIPLNDLKPGDAVGICGPNTGGDGGHIVLFDRWYNQDPNNDDYYLWEQAGGQRGPVYRKTTYPYGGPIGPWRAYRFKDIVDDGVTTTLTSASSTGGTVSIWDEKMTIENAERTMRSWLGQTWGLSRDNKTRLDALTLRIEELNMKMDTVVGILEDLQANGAPVVNVSAREIVQELIAQLSPRV